MDFIIKIILVAYFVSVAIFAAYYNYLYAIENGFLAWLFFGEIIASFKAFFWPLIELGVI